MTARPVGPGSGGALTEKSPTSGPVEVRLTGKSDTLVHAKLLDDTRLCPDADRDGFASSFLDIVTCPRCAPRLAAI